MKSQKRRCAGHLAGKPSFWVKICAGAPLCNGMSAVRYDLYMCSLITNKCSTQSTLIIYLTPSMSVFALWPVVFYKNVLVFSNMSYFSEAYFLYFYKWYLSILLHNNLNKQRSYFVIFSKNLKLAIILVLTNRLPTINNKIPLNWLNLYMSYFKMKCKETFPRM